MRPIYILVFLIVSFSFNAKSESCKIIKTLVSMDNKTKELKEYLGHYNFCSKFLLNCRVSIENLKVEGEVNDINSTEMCKNEATKICILNGTPTMQKLLKAKSVKYIFNGVESNFDLYCDQKNSEPKEIPNTSKTELRENPNNGKDLKIKDDSRGYKPNNLDVTTPSANKALMQ